MPVPNAVVQQARDPLPTAVTLIVAAGDPPCLASISHSAENAC